MSRTISFSKVMSLAMLCGLLAAPGAALAQAAKTERTNSLEEAIESLAKDVKKIVDAKRVESVVVGPFNPPPGASSGPRLVQLLTEKLKDKVKVVPAGSGAWGVSGDFFGKQDSVTQKFVAVIAAKIKDENGEQQGADLTRRIITDTNEVLSLMGITAEIPVKTTPAENAAGTSLEEKISATISESAKKPSVDIVGGVVRPSAESKSAIEIMLPVSEADYVSVPAVDKNGVAFVDIKPNQIYAIKLINKNDFAVGVTVTIDGVNTLAFSQNKEYKDLGQWVIGPKSEVILKGWHNVGNDFFKFQLLKYGDSASAKLGGNQNAVGTITATFCAAFEKDPPADEPPPSSGKRGAAEFGTGLGPAVQQDVQDVVLKFGAPRASISVRYINPEISDLPK